MILHFETARVQANPTRNPEAVEQSDGGISTDLLAMGCKSSAAIFQRAMDQVLAHFSSTNTFRVRRGGYERPMVSLKYLHTAAVLRPQGSMIPPSAGPTLCGRTRPAEPRGLLCCVLLKSKEFSFDLSFSLSRSLSPSPLYSCTFSYASVVGLTRIQVVHVL